VLRRSHMETGLAKAQCVGGKVTYSSSDEVGTSLLSFGVMIDVERKERGISIPSAII
jgi:hypothetical protein